MEEDVVWIEAIFMSMEWKNWHLFQEKMLWAMSIWMCFIPKETHSKYAVCCLICRWFDFFFESKAELVEEFKEVVKEFDWFGHHHIFSGFENGSKLDRDLCLKGCILGYTEKGKDDKVQFSFHSHMEPDTKLLKNKEGDFVDESRYQSLIGILRYLTNTRSYLMLSVWVTSHFMEKLRYSHWKALKRILGYVNETLSFELMYIKSNIYWLSGYSNSD